jgi:hypothetical protein
LSKIALSPNASGTGTFTVAAPNTNTDYTLTLPQGTGTVVANNVNSAIVSDTVKASTSGTSIDFTGIPSWVNRITVMFSGVSTNGSSQIQIQLGDSGGVEITGYLSSGVGYSGAALGTANYTAGFGLNTGGAAYLANGAITFSLLNASTNLWAAQGQFGYSNGAFYAVVAGSKALSGTLDRVRITTINGTDTFDAGSINILYE